MDSQRVVEQSLLDDGQFAVVTLDELVDTSSTHVHEMSLQEFGQCDCSEVLGIIDIWIVSCELQHPLVEQLVVLVTGVLKGIGYDQRACRLNRGPGFWALPLHLAG